MDRYVLISADCHAGAPTAAYREYLDPQFRDDFDDYLRVYDVSDPLAVTHASDGLHGQFRRLRQGQVAIEHGARGAWDVDIRMTELDREGVAGEVIFPDGQNGNRRPFEHPNSTTTIEQRAAGAKAHNRWLAEFCAQVPQRMAGLAVVLPYDVDDAVAEVRRSAREGLRGVLLTHAEISLPLWHDPCYDPLWRACTELGLVVHTHAGRFPEIYGPGPAGRLVGMYEGMFFTHRPLWLMVLGGVFTRFPELQLAFTEQGADWIPAEISRMQYVYEESAAVTMGAAVHDVLARSPRELWASNCLVGASFASQAEVGLRHDIGVDRIMWGSDYPHDESTWPNTWDRMRDAFVDVADDELRAMIGLNAARAYRFDLDTLAPVVERIGPPAGFFAGGERRTLDYEERDFATGAVFVKEIANRYRREIGTVPQS
jgi:predicted TIM-barrel fold metal-dependent hydrolase